MIKDGTKQKADMTLEEFIEIYLSHRMDKTQISNVNAV